VFLHFGLKRLLLAIGTYDGPDLAAPLGDSHNGGLILAAGASDAALALFDVHVPRLAADEGFIRFHFAGEQVGTAVCQSEAEAMRHEPCGLLGHPQIAGKLARTAAVLAIHQEPQGGKPLVQAESRVFENGSCLQGELGTGMATVALPHPVFSEKGHLRGATVGALNHAIGPAHLNHDLLAVLEIAEVDDGFLESLKSAAHGSIMRQNGRYVKYIITVARTLRKGSVIAQSRPSRFT